MSKQQEHISYLWQRFANKKATQEEIDALFEYLNDPSNDEISIGFLQQQFAQATTEEELDKEYWLDKLKLIVNENQPVVHTIPLHRRTWVRWAAAAVFIISLGVAVVVSVSKNPEAQHTLATTNQLLNNDVLPGRDRALLKLPDGEMISLDSARVNIIDQGDFTVFNQNGKLNYAGKDIAAQYHTLTTPKGGQYKLRLPDGTEVWLNAASSITYPTAFESSNRKVTVTGEAYFEVAKDKAKPFKVNVDGKSEVEVLGTHFNINSYGDDGNISTTLLEGSVIVNRGGSSGTSVILRPGQQSNVAVKNTGITVNSNVDVDKVMAWKNGLFNFEQADLKTVMAQLARWYDIDVKYEGDITPGTFRGKITRDLSLAQVIKGLEVIGMKFRIEGRTLIVMN